MTNPQYHLRHRLSIVLVLSKSANCELKKKMVRFVYVNFSERWDVKSNLSENNLTHKGLDTVVAEPWSILHLV